MHVAIHKDVLLMLHERSEADRYNNVTDTHEVKIGRRKPAKSFS